MLGSSPSPLAFVRNPYLTAHPCLAELPPPLDAVWASFWGLIFRKFFWDFVGGTLRDPGGLQ